MAPGYDLQVNLPLHPRINAWQHKQGKQRPHRHPCRDHQPYIDAADRSRAGRQNQWHRAKAIAAASSTVSCTLNPVSRRNGLANSTVSIAFETLVPAQGQHHDQHDQHAATQHIPLPWKKHESGEHVSRVTFELPVLHLSVQHVLQRRQGLWPKPDASGCPTAPLATPVAVQPVCSGGNCRSGSGLVPRSR